MAWNWVEFLLWVWAIPSSGNTTNESAGTDPRTVSSDSLQHRFGNVEDRRPTSTFPPVRCIWCAVP
jgi:hypothetical protein